MFGLSKKKEKSRLYILIEKACYDAAGEYADQVKLNVADGYIDLKDMSEETALDLRKMFFDEVDRQVAKQLDTSTDHSLKTRAMSLQNQPETVGLSEEFNLDYFSRNGRWPGLYWALYYAASTGKKISSNDYSDYINPLNKLALGVQEHTLSRIISVSR